MRTKNKTTTIIYSGRIISGPGDMLDGESFSGERNYTTDATALVMSSSPLIASHGNASGRQSFAVSRDFESFEKLLEHLLEVQDFMDANQTGELDISVGKINKRVMAGLVSMRYDITLVASYRLTLTLDFVTI